MRVGVVTAYYDRPQALRRYLEDCTLVHQPVTWYLGVPINSAWDVTHEIAMYPAIRNRVKVATCGNLSLGALRNQAAEMATCDRCDVLVKQDIDCTFRKYQLVAEALEEQPLINVGVRYQKGNAPPYWGNEYVMKASTWSAVGGEPEWCGYGWEDYAMIAKVLCHYGRSAEVIKAMGRTTVDNCTQVFRDQIARPLNRLHSFFMHHHEHQKNTTGAKENRVLFHQLIQGLMQ